MSVVTRVPEPNIWDEICKEFQAMKPSLRDADVESVKTDRQDYDPSKVTPVLYGKMASRVDADSDPTEAFDSARSHPALVGYSFVDRPPASPPAPAAAPPDKDKCSPREYLEHYIFPVLLPALERMLEQAKLERCFERKRTKFNALDFLTEYLYKNNPRQEGREHLGLLDIPFVQDWLKDHPRPPLPMSLLWTEAEATLIIQSHWRAYKVRIQPEVSELRKWQKEWQEENENISNKVSEFWDKQMPNNDELTPNASDEHIMDGNKPISVKSPVPQVY